MSIKKLTNIKYTSRDFDSIKNDLIDYAKRYYSNTFKDFNEASFGSLMLDSVAYIGDILSFYLDYQANESFLDTSLEVGNIIKHGKAKGYKPKLNPSSCGILTLYILVPASATGLGPDLNYIPTMKKGSYFGNSNSIYTLIEDVDFKTSTEIIVAEVNTNSGIPTQYAIKSKGLAVSGKILEEFKIIGAYEKFLKINIANTNITEIISVQDSSGNEFYEVEFLSQNVIYKPFPVEKTNNDDIGNILKPVIAARRFVVEKTSSGVDLQFGYGSETIIDSEALEDPARSILNEHGKNYITDRSFDPSIMIETDKFGIVPSNTTLRIVYRTNTNEDVNASSNSIDTVIKPIMYFTNENMLSPNIVANIRNSAEVVNESPFIGDVSFPDSSEIKREIYDTYAMQNRAVTLNDYKALVYKLPGKFGNVKRCNIINEKSGERNNINIYVISTNSNEKLIESGTNIKNNLKIWINNYKMLNDNIDILDAKIVNIGIDFSILCELGRDKYSILQTAIEAIKNNFKNPPDIGEPLYITDIYNVLKKVNYVIDAIDVKVYQKTGELYSSVLYDFENNKSADGRYIYFPENVIYEIKYPTSDIFGEVK